MKKHLRRSEVFRQENTNITKWLRITYHWFLFPFSESTTVYTEGYRIRWWELISSKYLVWTKNATCHISKQRMLQPSGLCRHPCKAGAPWEDSGWESSGHWPQTVEMQIRGTVTGGTGFDCLLDLVDFSFCYSLLLLGNPTSLPKC